MNAIVVKKEIDEVIPGRVKSGYILTFIFKDNTVMSYIYNDKEDFKRSYKRYGSHGHTAFRQHK